MIRRSAAALAVASLVLLALPACRRQAAEGGRFVYSFQTEPATLNFVTASDQGTVLIERMISDFLVDHDATLAVVPRLAESWEWSKDGLTLTFRLRPNVRFHDGVALTSADVLYTYERILDPKSKALGRVDGFLPVEHVSAPDPRTLVVKYREPYAPALRAWEIPILPAHRYRGADFETAPENRAPIGAGPFRFVAWEAGRRITLAANEDYWGGRPALDTFIIQFQPSLDTSLLALLSGDADFTKLTPAAWTSRRQDPAFVSRFRLISYTPIFFYYIAWRGDGSNPFFADPAVRRALGLVLDREGYVRSVLRGLGRITPSPFTVLSPAPADTAESSAAAPGPAAAATPATAGAYDPAAAARLLDAAGWKTSPRTGVRARGGIPFRFTLLVFAGSDDHVQFAQVTQDALRQVGVEMRVERLDWPALWSRLKSGDFEAALSGFNPTPDPDSLYGMLHSSQIAGGQNYAAFHDPEVDGWLDAGRRTLDAAGRAALYRRVEERLATAQPYACLFAPTVVGAMNARFDGAIPSPLGIFGHAPGALSLHLAAGAARTRATRFEAARTDDPVQASARTDPGGR